MTAVESNLSSGVWSRDNIRFVTRNFVPTTTDNIARAAYRNTEYNYSACMTDAAIMHLIRIR